MKKLQQHPWLFGILVSILVLVGAFFGIRYFIDSRIISAGRLSETQLYYHAQQAHAKRDYRIAARLYEKILDQEPKNAMVREKLVSVLVQERLLPEAIAQLENLIATAPTRDRAQMLVELYRLSGDDEKAEALQKVMSNFNAGNVKAKADQ